MYEQKLSLFWSIFDIMFAMDAYVPNNRPRMPNPKMQKSLTTHTGHEKNPKNNRCSLSGQKEISSRRDGNMKASALLAKAPMREIKSPRSGTPMAMIAARSSRNLCQHLTHYHQLCTH